MTNELEKQFFDIFNLTKYKLISKYNKLLTYGPFDTLEDTNTVAKGLMDCFTIEEVYPQITDRILLGIIAKIMWSYSCTQNDFDAYEVSTVDNLKEAVLKHAIELSKNDDYVYCGVRTLFEEG